MIYSRRIQGFSLIEVTVAIGIAAFCLLVIFALLPTGLNSNRDSVNTTVAAGLASGIIADLRAVPVPKGSATSPSYNFNPDADFTQDDLFLKEDGSVATGPSDADYRAAIEITTPVVRPGPTQVHVKITWPAGADPGRASVFEVVSALDRNP